MTLGMSNDGYRLVRDALLSLNDHDLALVPSLIEDMKQARKKQAREAVLRLRREEAEAQRQYERCCEKLGLSPEPEAP